MNTQPHRKRVKHHHNPGDFHELTFSTYRRTPLLTNDLWRIELSRCIDQANQTHQFELAAFVYMPEHLHLLVFPLTTQPDIGTYLAAIKQPVSSFVHSCLEDAKSPLLEKLTVRERPGKFCFRFWQEGPGFDRNLFTLKAIQGSIDYIHRNPVERKLCRRAIEYRWSSARYYLADPAKQQFEGLPTVHGLRAEVFDPNVAR
jgi:putative transposase